MLNHSPFWYVFIRACILFLHSIAPLSCAYTATVLRRAYLAGHAPPVTALNVWTAAETAFFLFFLWYRRHLQGDALHPPLQSKEERKKLFDKVRGEVGDIEKFLSGWFREAKVEEIGREDLVGWLDWAFWDGRYSSTEDGEEMEQLVQEIEKMVGKKFKEGEGDVKALRLTLDPVEIQWRSLLWYGCLMVVDTITHARMLRYGLKYHSSISTTYAVCPPRPLAVLGPGKKSPVEGLSYWTRPHTSKTRLPIVFIHGIGVGVYPYVEWFHELDLALNGTSPSKDDGQVGIMVLEILATSSRLTAPILTRPEFLRQITTVLDSHGYDKFVLASHSYGSVLTTHILTSTLASRVAGTLLIDPVTILLHMPDVAYNFTIRKPTTANEWQLWYFASKDPGVAATLGRHFFWYENILWRDYILELVNGGMRLTASLSGRDLIVDTAAVGEYLVSGDVPTPKIVQGNGEPKHMELEINEKEDHVREWREREWQGKGLEVLWWDDLDHAQVYDDKTMRGKLVEVLVEYSKGR